MILTRSLLSHFRNKRKDVILFMSSMGAHVEALGAGAYSATKGALESKRLCLSNHLTCLPSWPRSLTYQRRSFPQAW